MEGAGRVGGEGQRALRKMVWTEALMQFVYIKKKKRQCRYFKFDSYCKE